MLELRSGGQQSKRQRGNLKSKKFHVYIKLMSEVDLVLVV